MGPYCNHKYLLKGKQGRFHRRGEDNVTLKAETAGMQPQARQCWQSPQAGRYKEFSPRDLRGSSALLTLWFWSSDNDSGIWPPELRESAFLLFYAMQFGLILLREPEVMNAHTHCHLLPHNKNSSSCLSCTLLVSLHWNKSSRGHRSLSALSLRYLKCPELYLHVMDTETLIG